MDFSLFSAALLAIRAGRDGLGSRAGNSMACRQVAVSSCQMSTKPLRAGGRMETVTAPPSSRMEASLPGVTLRRVRLAFAFAADRVRLSRVAG